MKDPSKPQTSSVAVLHPVVLCLISHYPFLSCLRSSLERLVSHSEATTCELEELIAYLVLEVPLPIAGQCKVNFWPKNNTVITAAFPYLILDIIA